MDGIESVMRALPSPKRWVRESRWYPRMAALRERRMLRRSRERFADCLHRSDVFLVGHPKSGNTWMAYMLAILRDRDMDRLITLSNLAERVPTVHGAEERIGRHSSLPAPRLFRNEWPFHPDLYPRTVYLVRDPRAVLVSMFHMYRVLYPRDGVGMAAFVDEYLTYGCIRRWEPQLVRWDRQVEAWRARRDAGEQVLFVRFEDLLASRREVLREAARFAGIPFGPSLLDLAAERGDFASMRTDEERGGAAAYPGRKGLRGRFVRRGEAASWRDEMKPELRGRVERAFAPAMRELGYLA